MMLTENFGLASTFERNFKPWMTLLLSVPVVATYCILAAVYPYMAEQIARFALFFSVFLALPSLALGLALPLGDRSGTESFFFGYPVAQMLLFLLIFAGWKLRIPLLPLALPATSLLALPVLLRSPRFRPRAGFKTGDALLVFGVTACAVALCFLKFMHAPQPEPGHPATFFIDDPGTAGFVWSAVNSIEYGVPYSLPWASGFPDYPYHRIYHFIYGFATYLLKVDPTQQIMYFWAPAQWLMLAGALVAGSRRLAGFTLAQSLAAAVLILLSDGLTFNSFISIQTIAYHHTFFFGFPALLLMLFWFYGHLGGYRQDVSTLHAASCFFVAAATKASLLAFIPFAVFPVFVYRLLKRISVKVDLKLAASFLIFGCVLYFTHYHNLGNGQFRSKPFKLGSVLMGTIGNLVTLSYVLGPFALVTLMVADWDVVLRQRLKRDGQYLIMLLTFCLAFCVFLKVVGYIGGEVYFYWHARVIALVAFAALAGHALAWRTRLAAPLMAAVLAAGVLMLLYGNMQLWGARDNTNAKYMPADIRDKNIDYDELVGLQWASEHLVRHRPFFTNKDSINMNYLGGYVKSYLTEYFGFSGVQGYAWIGDFFSPNIVQAISARRVWVDKFVESDDPEQKREALRHIEAAYYFHCERKRPYDFSRIPELRKLYGNTSISIYEIVRPGTAAPDN